MRAEKMFVVSRANRNVLIGFALKIVTDVPRAIGFAKYSALRLLRGAGHGEIYV